MTSTPNDPERDGNEPATEALDPIAEEREQQADAQPRHHARADAGIPEPRVVREILPIYPRRRLRWVTVLVTFVLFLVSLVFSGSQALSMGWVPAASGLAPVIQVVDPAFPALFIAIRVLAPLTMVLAACCVGRYRVATKVFALLVVLGAFCVADLGMLLMNLAGLFPGMLGLPEHTFDESSGVVVAGPGVVGTVVLLVGLLGLVLIRPQATYKRTVA